VSEIYRNFTRQLRRWQTRYAGRPDLEMRRLCLLALEREQNVVMTYNENVLGQRLSGMPLPDEVRELFRHALAWVWREEEMHAVYIRGALLRLGDRLLTTRALLRQAAGAIGGWTVAVRQHVPWTAAPLSRSGATLLMWAGALSGQIPPEIRRRLRYGSFRDFCRYNMEAERTAWLCWERLAELGADVLPLSGGQVDDFRRVAWEEERHRQVFAILADALNDDDELQRGQTPEHLSARFAAVGECFLPRSKRPSIPAYRIQPRRNS
jgi:hypothetical protein